MHKTTFSQEEIDRLDELIQEKQNTVGKSGQKRIRDKMRTIGFYISDFPGSRDFGVSDFRLLLRKGLIKVIDEAKTPLTTPRASHILKHDNLWEWCQKKSDMLLSFGLKQLDASKVFPWGSGYIDGPGVYLFIEGSKKLYVGESLSISSRLKQHCEGGKRSTFLKNFAEKRHHSKEAWAIDDTLAYSKENVQIQSLWVDIGRKELEEFGMVNFPTVLNKFHKGKRDRYLTDSQDDDLWDNIQNQAIDIIKEGAEIVKDLSPMPWINANPSNHAGLYVVWHGNDLIYIGETTNLSERYQAHSNKTYFSALRRSVGSKILNLSFIGKKKYTQSDDTKVTDFLLECRYSSLEASFGRRELEEYLIQTMRPRLNIKAK